MSSYATIELHDLNLAKLKLIKETYQWFDNQDHSRWIFQSRESGDYFKIWNPTYIRRDHILRGLEAGFYDESTVPAFRGVIIAEGVCRGYVMHKCKPVRERDLDFHALILEKTAQTGFFSVQYSRYHAMRYGTCFSLIDLEAVHHLSELRTLTSRYHCFFDDPEYERFVVDLYCGLFPRLPALQPHTPLKQKSSLMEKMYSRFWTFTQRLSNYWGVIFNHVEMIE